MKKVFSLLITLAMLVSTMVVPMTVSADTTTWDGTTDSSWISTGDGSEADPYEISSAAQLADLAKVVFNAISTTTTIPVAPTDTESMFNAYTGTYFKLTSDIDLGGRDWTPIGRMGMRFNGNFDGDGHIIKNLNIDTLCTAIGLFGATGKNVAIKNLGIEDAEIIYSNGGTLADVNSTDASYTWVRNNRTSAAAALVGVVGGGAIENCYVKNVKAKNTIPNGCAEGIGTSALIGGGYSVDTSIPTVSIRNCYVIDAEIMTGAYEGGGAMVSRTAIGANDPTRCSFNFENCYVGGDVSITLKTDANTYKGYTLINCMNSDSNSIANSYTTGITVYNMDGTTLTAGTLNTTGKSTIKGSAEVVGKEKIVSNISTVSGWSADNEQSPINDGYPVLAWQNTWESIWDGTTVDTSFTGTGTSADPYLITSAEELAGLAKILQGAISTTTDIPVDDTDVATIYHAYTGKCFKLMKDINLDNKEWLPIGRWGMRFDGTFDGNGHVVQNVYGTTEYSAVGLFGGIGANATVKNLGVDGVDIQTNVGSATDYDSSEPSKSAHNRIRAYGGLVGAMSPGATIDGCFAKNVILKTTADQMNHYGMGGLVGTVMYETYPNADNYNKFTIKDSYVKDVTLHGYTGVGAFFGNCMVNSDYRCNPKLTNCYVAGKITLTHNTGDATTLYAFGNASRFDRSQCVFSNVYTTTNEYQLYNTEKTESENRFVTYADQATIESALVIGDDTWHLDSVSAPTNGGYPVLGWEYLNDSLASYKGTGVTVADGKVTEAKLIKSYSDVDGVVYVVVYDGTRFVSAATAAVVDGVADIDDMAVSSGNTIKVFVWDSASALNPLSLVYSTTVE